MGDFPGTIDQLGAYFNQMSRALNTIGDNQKAMAANMKTMADNQQTMALMAEDITSLIVRSKRQDAVLKCMAVEFETAYPACSLAAKIGDILDAD